VTCIYFLSPPFFFFVFFFFVPFTSVSRFPPRSIFFFWMNITDCLLPVRSGLFFFFTSLFLSQDPSPAASETLLFCCSLYTSLLSFLYQCLHTPPRPCPPSTVTLLLNQFTGPLWFFPKELPNKRASACLGLTNEPFNPFFTRRSSFVLSFPDSHPPSLIKLRIPPPALSPPSSLDRV